jgi:peptidoglycan/LPS O-acetylase OafA/YrhL
MNRKYIIGKHWLAGSSILGLLIFYWYFDANGGFYGFGGSHPSSSLLWVFLPTVEALTYACAIAWYDSSFRHIASGCSKFLGLIGTCSYSIYLLHFYFYPFLAYSIHRHIIPLNNFYISFFASLVCFLFMIIPGYMSHRWIEMPWLKFRKKYIQSVDA